MSRGGLPTSWLLTTEPTMTAIRPQHEPNGVLCFDAPMGTDQVTAFVSESSLRARYGGLAAACDDVAQMYQLHQCEIVAAVVRRIKAGARQPVVLRVSDL
jgi:hypothetical protein